MLTLRPPRQHTDQIGFGHVKTKISAEGEPEPRAQQQAEAGCEPAGQGQPRRESTPRPLRWSRLVGLAAPARATDQRHRGGNPGQIGQAEPHQARRRAQGLVVDRAGEIAGKGIQGKHRRVEIQAEQGPHD